MKVFSRPTIGSDSKYVPTMNATRERKRNAMNTLLIWISFSMPTRRHLYPKMSGDANRFEKTATATALKQTSQGGTNDQSSWFVSPYCAEDGKSIFLGIYSDNTCHNQIKESLSSVNSVEHGMSTLSSSVVGLFLSTSIITLESVSCLSCAEDDSSEQNQNGTSQKNPNARKLDSEPTEMCESPYNSAFARCQRNTFGNFEQDLSGCDYLESTGD